MEPVCNPLMKTFDEIDEELAFINRVQLIAAGTDYALIQFISESPLKRRLVKTIVMTTAMILNTVKVLDQHLSDRNGQKQVTDN